MSHTLKLCTVKQLKTDYGIPYCRQHIWRLIRAGQFPAPGNSAKLVSPSTWLISRNG